MLGRYIPTIFHGDVAAAHRLPKESTPSYQNDSPVSCQEQPSGIVTTTLVRYGITRMVPAGQLEVAVVPSLSVTSWLPLSSA